MDRRNIARARQASCWSPGTPDLDILDSTFSVGMVQLPQMSRYDRLSHRVIMPFFSPNGW
jgi:hypothetical protein